MDTITTNTRHNIFMVFDKIMKNKISLIENSIDGYDSIKKLLIKSSNQFDDIIFVNIYGDDNNVENFIDIMNLIFRLSIYLEAAIDIFYSNDNSYISSMIEKIISVIDNEYRYYWDR